MAKIDETYHNLLNKILNEGYKYEDPNRKNIFRYQISDYKIVHDFKDGFPAITTKELYWKGIVGELLWILRGDTNIKYLVDNGINIWNKDAYNYHCLKNKIVPKNINEFIKCVRDEDNFYKNKLGDLGRGYGAQLRSWHANWFPPMDAYTGEHKTVDQLADLIHTLKTNPMATKKTVTFWNPAEKDQCALTPCHWSFEILVEPIRTDRRISLSCVKGTNCEVPKGDEKWDDFLDKWNIPKYQFTLKWHQHSVDTFLGLPFNIASYALLAQIIGKMTNMVPKGIIGDLSNVHIYEPHLDAVKEQLNRNIDKYDNTNLLMLDEFHYITDKELVGELSANEIINNLRIDMFKLNNYNSYPSIKAEMLAYNK